MPNYRKYLTPMPPALATFSSHDAWQRWKPLWYGIFYVMLIFSLFLSQRNESHTTTSFMLLLGLSALLAIWYGFFIASISHRVSLNLQHHLLLSTIYLVIGWGLWFGLTWLDSSYMFLLFGLYPQIFVFRQMPWKIIDALILTVLSLWRQTLSLQIDSGSVTITLVATGCGIIATIFIEAIIRQSKERQLLIQQLKETRQALASAERQAGITEERQRLAHEIHDTLVQGFTSVVMHLEAAEEVLPTDIKTSQLHIHQARRTSRENLGEARRLLWALQPEALDHASLDEVLTSTASKWSEENGVVVSAIITGTSHALRPEVEVALLRAVQETLTNASKYAHADQVTLTLSYMDDMVILDVQDNGCGFDTACLVNTSPDYTSGGFGLKALRERIGQLGGTLDIESTIGEGTTIAISLPVRNSEPSISPAVVEVVQR